jgi:hypothetical protein
MKNVLKIKKIPTLAYLSVRYTLVKYWLNYKITNNYDPLLQRI